jgi:glycosyltransferase involved in cell wall biosynthesis
VNVDFFRPDLLTPEAVIAEREKLGLPTDKPVVAYLGLLADYQGTHLLIEAAQILHQRGVEAHFLIMGFPGIQRYRQMADELGVLDCTTFTGKIPYEQAPKHLALGDIAVAPKLSDTEGAGKILNYMAMALPTVAFETPVSREYLGELGTYADATGDPRSLADAIERLIEHRELRTALGRKLRARVARHFSLDHLGEQLVDVYQGLLTKRHKT